MKCCELNFTIEEQKLCFSINQTKLKFEADLGYVQSSSYASLIDKPQINFRTLNSGNNTYEYLGVEPTITDITEQDIDNLIFGG